MEGDHVLKELRNYVSCVPLVKGHFLALRWVLKDGWIIEGKVRAFTGPEGLIEQGHDPQRNHPSSCLGCAQSVLPCPWGWGDLLATLTGSCSLHTSPSSRAVSPHAWFLPPTPSHVHLQAGQQCSKWSDPGGMGTGF